MNIDYAVEYRGEWGPVSGELLHDIAPHLAHVATFAVNRGYALDAFWWTVTNLETGRKVFYSTSKGRAVEGAQVILATKTVRQILLRYSECSKHEPLKTERIS